ncbi:MAG: diacylglycerol/lipid kinase family protein, partial [Lachnospiraceae bacterium]
MKHIFIINPNAGSGTAAEELKEKLAETNYDWKIYTTPAAGDAVRFIREWCDGHTEPVRFYACGGDGTLHEVANGIYGYPQASMSCYPIGSGNDFVKYYGGKERFLDPVALCAAPEAPIDLIRVNDRYAINACHFGLDSCVAETMNRIKHRRFLGGRRAYAFSVVYAFFK